MIRLAWYKQLYFQVIIGILLGIILGYYYPHFAIKMKPLGDGFIKLIRMMVVPIIFTTIVLGIAKMRDLKEFGRIGIKALIYFEILTTCALIIGLIVANLSRPGASLNMRTSMFDTSSIAQYMSHTTSTPKNATDFILNIIPNTFISAFANGDILSVLFIAILFGFGIIHSGKKRQSIVNFFDNIANIFFAIVGFIMYFAPLGAFGAMAYTIGAHGLSTLLALSKLLANVYLTSLLFIVLILGSVAKIMSFNLWHFIKYIKEEIFLVLGTSTSEVALPQLLVKLEQLGCSKTVTGITLPLGYTFNLDGTSIYLTIAVLFIAQAFNIDLSWTQQLSILGILLLTSKGAAAVTGGGFIVLASTLASTHAVPVEGMILLLGVDKFMSEVRALTNLIGNGVATIVIAKLENEFDANKAREFII